MKFFTLTALLLLLAGCSAGNPPRTYDVRIEPDMSTEQMQIILDGLAEWEAAAVVHFNVRISHEECGMTLVPGSRGGCIYLAWVDDDQAEEACHSPGMVGCTTSNNSPLGFSSNVLLGTRQRLDWEYRGVVLHEVGHALGLVHTAPGTIMCAGTGGASRNITQADVDQFDALRAGN